MTKHICKFIDDQHDSDGMIQALMSRCVCMCLHLCQIVEIDFESP